MSLFSNIRVVLVRSTHPGNVGAAARAMKNMALERLVLADPQCDLDTEASARAAGAEDVLHRAVICPSLDEAIADCELVVGSSARARRIEWPTLDPHEAAADIASAALGGQQVALLFGQERIGLTNEELDRCRAVVTIPVSNAYPSLNLACAVQVLAYEIFRAGAVTGAETQAAGPALCHADMIRFRDHLEAALVDVGFLDPENPRLLMRRLMRLFHRAAPDPNEMNILRGILTAMQTTARRARGGAGPRNAR
jgi:tRNA (cytidine32/uridine32-2'-O)-methyltransferase